MSFSPQIADEIRIVPTPVSHPLADTNHDGEGLLTELQRYDTTTFAKLEQGEAAPSVGAYARERTIDFTWRLQEEARQMWQEDNRNVHGVAYKNRGIVVIVHEITVVIPWTGITQMLNSNEVDLRLRLTLCKEQLEKLWQGHADGIYPLKPRTQEHVANMLRMFGIEVTLLGPITARILARAA